MRHCYLFLFPLTLSSDLSSLAGVKLHPFLFVSRLTRSHPYTIAFSNKFSLFQLWASSYTIFNILLLRNIRGSRGELVFLLFSPQHVRLYHSSFFISPHPYSPDIAFAFGRWMWLITSPVKIHSASAVLLPTIQSIYPSSAVLLTSLCPPPFCSSFQFPLLEWDVVYRAECVLYLSPAPVRVLGGGNGSIRKQRVVLCKYTATSVWVFPCE